MPHFAWGIDVGDGTLKAVRLKAEGRNLRVVRVVEIPYLDPFLKQNSLPSALDRRGLAALVQFGSTVKIPDGDRVSACFPSFHAVEGVMETPRVEDNQKESMIQYEVANAVNAPVQDLAIHYRHQGFASEDTEHVLFHAVKKEELEFFLHALKESRIACDTVVSPGAALMKMSNLAGIVHSQFLIISFGFSTAILVAARKSDFWTRSLPLSLPVAPGKTIEVARDRVNEMCEILANEIDSFVQRIIPDGSFQPAKVFISGEGARVPSLINALDSTLSAPVEVLRPGSHVKVDPAFEGMPSESTIQSMGKAMGLAAAALDDSIDLCPLAEPLTERRILRRLPLLSLLSGLVLLMVLGMGALELVRSARIQRLEEAFAMVPTPDRARDMERLLAEQQELEEKIEILNRTHEARGKFINLGKLLARFEMESPRGTEGDYHMTELDMDFGTRNHLISRIGTRMGDEEGIRSELINFFQAAAPSPRLSGPYPAEEETPPKGMAPLVMYEIEGALK